MTTVASPAANAITPHPTAWIFPTAIAGTIGSMLGFGTAFFLWILLRSPSDALPSTPEAIRTMLFWNDLLHDSLAGGTVGLAIGTAFAFTWEAFMMASSDPPARWKRTTILSYIVGSVVAWVLHSSGVWYGVTAIERALVGGFVGGGIAGGVQALTLWHQRAAQWRWTVLQALAFGSVFVLLMQARDHVSSVLIFPLVWLSLWGLYGWCLGTGFDHLQYNYPNPQE